MSQVLRPRPVCVGPLPGDLALRSSSSRRRYCVLATPPPTSPPPSSDRGDAAVGRGRSRAGCHRCYLFLYSIFFVPFLLLSAVNLQSPATPLAGALLGAAIAAAARSLLGGCRAPARPSGPSGGVVAAEAGVVAREGKLGCGDTAVEVWEEEPRGGRAAGGRGDVAAVRRLRGGEGEPEAAQERGAGVAGDSPSGGCGARKSWRVVMWYDVVSAPSYAGNASTTLWRRRSTRPSSITTSSPGASA